MQLTPEIKAQLAEQKKQCIFCKLISKEMDVKVVFEDDVTFACLDIHPARKGHTVFMTKEHYPIMPYIPAGEFHHLFGLVPSMAKAVQEGIVSLGMNVFIANGGAAGQTAPHFLIHFLPRDKGDGFFNFMFKEKAELQEQQKSMLKNNFPIMMANHFKRNPASWHVGAGERPQWLGPLLGGTVIYEDEKGIAVLKDKGSAPGHIQIFSKAEKSDIGKVSQEDGAHLFYMASFAATAVFEGLGAHATNIIAKSGITDDNPDGVFSLHIIPRMQGDNMGFMWQPKEPSYNLDQVKSLVKEHMWKVKYDSGKKSQTHDPVIKPKTVRMGFADDSPKEKSSGNMADEIQRAIEKVKR